MSMDDVGVPRLPLHTRGITWTRQNLFSSWSNTLLTVLAIYLLWLTIPPMLNWLIFDSVVSGTDKSACQGAEGACWTFVKMNLGQFIYGFYPVDERWRVDLAVFAPVAVLVILAFGWKWYVRQIMVYLLFVHWLVAFILLQGGMLGLPLVETAQWGGLMLTLIVSMVGIVASLPLGVILALGRRSDMPAVRAVCVVFIEVVRGVPLITVLFMASFMLPLFMPDGITINKLLRALIGVALFAAAYMAETIRGGLQAIPKGQFEAAHALGLTYWQGMRLIILPQALKLVIPGIVNAFISLLKDTTLVSIIGLFDLLGRVQAAASNPAWLGFTTEGYAFAALVFWAMCFGMSRYSLALERKLDTGHRRK
ncbi:amino acid ABC transporter permease [Zavarzinia sp. CC-PAN008]|uniref:amino acid ABC transporter permease n=1 Tax=Zavarzinia sp. CC-PAN008 TaxID=3243332 RepID=UPI003F7460AD